MLVITRDIKTQLKPIQSHEKSHETTIFLWFSYGFPMVFIDYTPMLKLQAWSHWSQPEARQAQVTTQQPPLPLRSEAPGWCVLLGKASGKTIGKWWFNGISWDFS